MLPVIACLALAARPLSFADHLAEIADPSRLASFPGVQFECLQASSYNRESTERGKPGWFADSDGVGFIREERVGGRTEWVMMEHTGPGCLTKFWTPFFYYDFNERTGPNIRVYLDGSDTPVIDESYIKLVTGAGSIKTPWAAYSARAGSLILPIPFGKSAKVTMTRKPFYFIINYRAYAAGTPVETFSTSLLQKHAKEMERAARRLVQAPDPPALSRSVTLLPGKTATIPLPDGPGAADVIAFRLEEALTHPETLRSTVLSARFDGRETIWAPLGDFFCSADSVHPFETMTRQVRADGTMVSRWTMPYRTTGQICLTNFGKKTVHLRCAAAARPRAWTSASMHFYARWRPDDIVPGTPFQDWNYVDISGKGVYVGDAWTVLNIRPNSWWGEGDEKIYVDDANERGFPTHFGTGTEDYYGWAGGVYPVLEDQFSAPFLANVKVGGLDGHTQGFNICTRVRGLDAIPFRKRLRFDMESSFGTDMREKWDLLGYSAMTFWYAMPGAAHNRPARPEAAAATIMSVAQVRAMSERIRAGG